MTPPVCSYEGKLLGRSRCLQTLRRRVGHAVALGATSVLSACVSMSGLGGEAKYACAAPEGVACQSVSANYANATRSGATGQRSSSRPAPGVNIRDGWDAELSGADRSAHAWRTQVRVLRLWTKAWEDADGDLWDQGYLYVQVSSGSWRIEHIRQLARDRFTPVRPPPGASAPMVEHDTESAEPSTLPAPDAFSAPSTSTTPSSPSSPSSPLTPSAPSAASAARGSAASTDSSERAGRLDGGDRGYRGDRGNRGNRDDREERLLTTSPDVRQRAAIRTLPRLLPPSRSPARADAARHQ